VLKNSAGMTLIEVLISMVIVFILFLGLSGAGIFVFNENIKNDLRDEAVSVADNEVQSTRRILFANLDNATHVEYRQIRRLNDNVSIAPGVKYTVTRTVSTLDPQNKQVTINVVWNRLENNKPKTYTHQVISIVRR